MGRFLLASLITVVAAFAAVDDWAHWRGPNRDGIARGAAPLSWSDSENIKWKVNIPGKGNSSPVIWGDTIYLTTAIQIGETPPQAAAPPPPPRPPRPEAGAQGEGQRRGRRGGRGGGRGRGSGPQAEHKFVVTALDKSTGKVRWEKTATTATPHEGHHRTYGSFASNTPATDGKHVIAFFGSRGVYCYTMDGELVWKKDLGVKMRMRNAFGEGVAPTLYKDALILKFDHEGDSFIITLDKNTGEELWRKPRDEISGWSSPLVVEHDGRTQVIVGGTTRVRGYDLKTGEVIWECGGLGANAIPDLLFEDGIVWVMSGYRDPNMMAIKLGEGDLTGTDAVLWSQTRGAAYTASPVLHDGKLYVLTDRGMISCFNAKTGEPYYHQQRLPGPYSFKASLVGTDGKLYLSSENEDVIVLKMGEEFEVLATNKLTDQMFIATPAISEGEIFLRGQNTLFCIR
ncbi:MAG: PQQ-binding-like beta-propeller repeat protein [bacterium]|nr:PQQ-binding-like beta-propeller repeat protein [bacterium]